MFVISLLLLFLVLTGVLVLKSSMVLWKKLVLLAGCFSLPVVLFVLAFGGGVQRYLCSKHAAAIDAYFVEHQAYPRSLDELDTWNLAQCDYVQTDEGKGYIMTFMAGGFTLGIYKNGELFFD